MFKQSVHASCRKENLAVNLSHVEDRLTYVFGSRGLAKAPEIRYTAEFITHVKYENSHKGITGSMEASKMNSIFGRLFADSRYVRLRTSKRI